MPKIASSNTSVKPPRRHRCETLYRVQNWAAYEAGLKQRGSLTFYPSSPSGVVLSRANATGSARHLFCFGYSNGVDVALGLFLAPAPNRGVSHGHSGVDGGGFAGARSHDPLPATGRFEPRKALKPNGKGTNLATPLFMQQRRCQWSVRPSATPAFASHPRSSVVAFRLSRLVS